MALEKLLSKIDNEELKAQFKSEFEKASSKEGYFSQSELDRRINEVSQKHIHDEKEMEKRIREQIEEEAKLSAEEKANKILAKAEETLKAAHVKENNLTALTQLTEAGMDKKDAETMLAFIVTDDAEATQKNIESVLKVHTNLQNSIKKELMEGTPKPDSNDGSDGAVTKKKFDEMTFTEKVKFKNEHPEQAKAFMGQ